MTEFEKTKPYVFIIESLDLQDEENQHFEGEIISKILSLSQIEHKYYYIRTKAELEYFLEEFERVNYRYLHISCHGSSKSISTTLETVTFKDLSLMLGDKLDRKRLFLSSCLSTNEDLANEIFSITDCFSIIGPDKKIPMDDAAIFWSSFYQVMFKRNRKAMNKENLKDVIIELKSLFQVSLKYFSASKSAENCWKEIGI